MPARVCAFFHSRVIHDPAPMGVSPSVEKAYPSRQEAQPERASEVGFMLLAENLRSVLYRYGGDETMRPEWAREPYTWRDPGYRLTVAEALKALDCLEYQSCEHPGWHDSEAAQFAEALRRALVHALKGYEAAPWEWTKVPAGV